MNGTRKEMLRNLSLTRERESLRNRCPSGQKAFIVLFRYGRRHKRGQPNSYGCRFCNIRVRPPIDRTDDHRDDPFHPSKSHETPTKHATSPRVYERLDSLEPWKPASKQPGKKTLGERKRLKRRVARAEERENWTNLDVRQRRNA